MGNATPKQIEALRKMGYDIKDDASFEEASKMFDDHKAKKLKKEQPEASKGVKEYHLTPEQVKYNALDITLRRYPDLETPALIAEARQFVKFFLE